VPPRRGARERSDSCPDSLDTEIRSRVDLLPRSDSGERRRQRLGRASTAVIAMIFEFSFDQHEATHYQEYLEASASLRQHVSDLDGFLGIERFESVSAPGRFVAIGLFRDEGAVESWRNDPTHRRAQILGRERCFADYRLIMADVIRDYGATERSEAPEDSRRFHGRRASSGG